MRKQRTILVFFQQRLTLRRWICLLLTLCYLSNVTCNLIAWTFTISIVLYVIHQLLDIESNSYPLLLHLI